MTKLEVHFKKYKMFKEDAENEDVSYPMRIEAYFASAFHIIEACCALHNIHINKHSMIRRTLEENPEIFGEETRRVWELFQRIENQLRPGLMYGARENGEALEEVRESFEEIEEICLRKLKGLKR